MSEQKIPTIRLVRAVCKKCRNTAYKDHPAKNCGMWNDKDPEDLASAFWPKGEGPYREKYKDDPNAEQFCVAYCPGPVISKWVEKYYTKIYQVLLESSALSKSEKEIIEVGLNHLITSSALDLFEEYHPKNINKSDKKGEWYKLFIVNLPFKTFRLGLNLPWLRPNRRCYEEPPIWCPYQKEHDNPIKI